MVAVLSPTQFSRALISSPVMLSPAIPELLPHHESELLPGHLFLVFPILRVIFLLYDSPFVSPAEPPL